jgi:hypothetical protein
MSNDPTDGKAFDARAVPDRTASIDQDESAASRAADATLSTSEPPSALALQALLTELDADPSLTSEEGCATKLRALREYYTTADVSAPDAFFAELIAFSVHAPYPDTPSRWGTYFGPIMTGQTATGEPWESPSRADITDEMLLYWRRRAPEARNPIMRARYADLVWELPPVLNHLNDRQRDAAFARVAIDAYLEATSPGWYDHEMVAKHRVERALALSALLRDPERIVRSRDALVDLEDSIASDEFAGLWGFSFDTLVESPSKHIPVPDALRDRLVDDLEQRLTRFASGPPDQYHPHGPEAAALRLAEYYRRQNRLGDVERVLVAYEIVVLRMEGTAAPLVAAHSVEQLYRTYVNFGLRDRADALNAIIQRLGKATHEAMSEHTVSVEISREKVDAYFDELLAGDPAEVLGRIMVQFLPRRAQIQAQVLDLAKKTPFLAMLGRKITDASGRTIAIIGSVDEDINGNVVRQMAENLRIGAGFLHEAFHRGLERASFTRHDLMAAVFESAVIRQDRRTIVERGLRAALDGDDLIAAHLLIPQVEAGLREAAGLTGVAIYKARQGGGLQLRVLDDLLRDHGMTEALGEDLTFYFRALFTDQRAWNLRNTVAHGLLAADAFGPVVSDRLIHAFLMLGGVRAVEDGGD